MLHHALGPFIAALDQVEVFSGNTFCKICYQRTKGQSDKVPHFYFLFWFFPIMQLKKALFYPLKMVLLKPGVDFPWDGGLLRATARV